MSALLRERLARIASIETRKNGTSAPIVRCFRLTNGECADMPIKAVEFFADNPDLLGTDIERAVMTLAPGEVYEGGGGAAETWSIRRTA